MKICSVSIHKFVSPSHFELFFPRLKQCPGQAVHVQQRAQVRVGFQDAGSTGKLGARQLRILR
jgi:hypothetical protein